MTPDTLLILPLVLPLAAAVLAFPLRRSLFASRLFALIITLSMVILAGLLFMEVHETGAAVLYLGNWYPPFGICFVADYLSALMVGITAIIALTIAIYGCMDIGRTLQSRGYYPLFFILLAGVNGAFLTGDIFNLYVWFEVILISSFCLMVLGREKRQIDAGVKYVALNLVKTALLLLSIGLLYGMTGTLNMADLHLTVQHIYAYGNSGTVTVIALMLMLAFGIKAGMFPLFFWLPASYHTPTPAIAALFAGLLTKVGVYALLRVFTLIFPLEQTGLQPLLIVIAVLTMLTGMAGAISEQKVKRILAFNLIGHIGTMLLGLGIYTALALKGVIFYMLHHMIVMAALFLTSGIMRRMTTAEDLRSGGGLYERSPLLAILFLIPALSLAGLPPFSGFWGKLVIVQAGLETQHYVLVAAILLTGFLTLFSVARIWLECFWKPSAHPESDITLVARDRIILLIPVALLATLTAAIGLYAEPLMVLAGKAGDALLDPSLYIITVLGGKP